VWDKRETSDRATDPGDRVSRRRRLPAVASSRSSAWSTGTPAGRAVPREHP
jgi:hypothetical protein